MEDWERNLRAEAEALLSDNVEIMRERSRETDAVVRDERLRAWVKNADRVGAIMREIDERKWVDAFEEAGPAHVGLRPVTSVGENCLPPASEPFLDLLWCHVKSCASTGRSAGTLISSCAAATRFSSGRIRSSYVGIGIAPPARHSIGQMPRRRSGREKMPTDMPQDRLGCCVAAKLGFLSGADGERRCGAQ